MRLFQRCVSILAALALALSAVSVPTGHAAEESADQCPAVEIVVVGGSFSAKSSDDPSVIYGMPVGRNFAKEMADRYPGRVTAWQVPYPSTVSILGSSLHERPEVPQIVVPYGASVREGVENGTTHMAEVAQRCPTTKFMVAGYSQGASVAGDIVAAVGRGEVAGVSPDAMIGAYLLADPGRSALTGESVVTGYAAQAEGVRGASGEVLVVLDQGAPPPTYIGATGARGSGAFAPFGDRVMSFCAPKDPACAMAPERLPQLVSQEMNNFTDAPAHRAALEKRLKDPKVAGILLLLLLPITFLLLIGVYAPIPRMIEGTSKFAGLNDSQKAALVALATELERIGLVARNYGNQHDVLAPLNREVDKLSSDGGSSTGTMLSSAVFSQLVKGEQHLHYFTDAPILYPSESDPSSASSVKRDIYLKKVYTIDGTIVDEWIRDDIDARISTVLDEKLEDEELSSAP